MRGSRFNEEQIIGYPAGGGGGGKDARGMSPARHRQCATFYKWKAKYGGLEVSEACLLKSLEDENRRLKKLLAERCWTTRRSRTCWEKTVRACGATRSRYPTHRAVPHEPDARMQAGGAQPFEPELSGEAAGRFDGAPATA